MPDKPDDNLEQKLLTSGEAAKYLHISQDTFNRRVKQGLIHPVKGIPSKWKHYTIAELNAYRERWEQEQNDSN